MPDVASKITRVTLDAARLIEGGNSIKVYGLTISNTSGAAVTVTATDVDDVAILTLTIPDDSSNDFYGPWLADNGLKFPSASSANVVVSVAHSASGV